MNEKLDMKGLMNIEMSESLQSKTGFYKIRFSMTSTTFFFIKLTPIREDLIVNLKNCSFLAKILQYFQLSDTIFPCKWFRVPLWFQCEQMHRGKTTFSRSIILIINVHLQQNRWRCSRTLRPQQSIIFLNKCSMQCSNMYHTYVHT